MENGCLKECGQCDTAFAFTRFTLGGGEKAMAGKNVVNVMSGLCQKWVDSSFVFLKKYFNVFMQKLAILLLLALPISLVAQKTNPPVPGKPVAKPPASSPATTPSKEAAKPIAIDPAYAKASAGKKDTAIRPISAIS